MAETNEPAQTVIEPDSGPAEPGAGGFADRLVSRIDALRSPMCVGLDPVLERLPEEIRRAHADACGAIRAFCLGVLESVHDTVPAIKVQSACFERYGSAGIGVLEDVIERARGLGLLVILDAKRGDIGLTMEHYAEGAANLRADAVTASPYLGVGPLGAYLDRGLGVFALVRTSNPEGDRIQRAKLEDARTVSDMVADEVATLGAKHVGDSGLSGVGAVVGATKGKEAAVLRERLPQSIILAPGFGAQGGDAGAIRKLRRADANSPGGLGVLVAASRSILYPDRSGEWRAAVRDSATETIGRLRGALGL